VARRRRGAARRGQRRTGKLVDYFADAGGSNNRIHMLLDFMLNGRLVLALAREHPEAVIETLTETPALPPGAQWATFLRNHDEIDLSRLTAEQRDEVFAKFGPKPEMRLYDRGIRRGWPRYSAATGPGSRWPTRCSSRCVAHRSCATARRSAWATIFPNRVATRSEPRCNGRI